MENGAGEAGSGRENGIAVKIAGVGDSRTLDRSMPPFGEKNPLHFTETPF